MTTTPAPNPIGALLAPLVAIEANFDPILQPLLTPLGTDPTTLEPLIKAEGPLTAINTLGTGQTPQFILALQNIPTILANLPGLPQLPGNGTGTGAAQARARAAAAARAQAAARNGQLGRPATNLPINRMTARQQAQLAKEAEARRVIGYGNGQVREERPTLG